MNCLAFIVLALSSVLSSKFNPQADDRLYLNPIEYVDTVSSGVNRIWDFSNVSFAGHRVKLTLLSQSESDDSLACIIGGTQYLIHMADDTLFYDGYENTVSSVKLQCPEIILSPDVFAGKCIKGSFHGAGRYANRWNQEQYGDYETALDARGCLITAEADTIKDVFRISTGRNVVHRQMDDNSPTDSVQFYQRISRIFASGYRYPVIYASAVYSAKSGKLLSHKSYYTPLSEIERLSDNESLSKNGGIESYSSQRDCANDATSENNDVIEYSIMQDKESHSLNIAITAHKDCDVEAVLAGITGIIYDSKKIRCVGGENYNVVFEYGKLPYSAAYGVNILVEDQHFSEKFYR